MASKLTLLSLPNWSWTGFGRRYEDFVHQGSCTLQYKMIFVKEINPSFTVGRLNQRRKKKKKKMMNNRHFYNFPRITVAVYFTEFESIIVYRGTLRAHCSSEKAYNFRVRQFSARVLLYGANGRVCAIPTYRVYRLYDICLYFR